MAQGDTEITFIGNCVADPELRFTPAGVAVANIRVASTPRFFNKTTNQWEDGDAVFLTVNAWRDMAEGVAESITKGMRVMVKGVLRQRTYQAKDGSDRTIYEIEAEDIGPSLKYAKAQVTRNPRNNQGGGGFGGQQGNTGGFGGGQQGGYNQNQPNTGGFGGQQAQNNVANGLGGQPAPDNDPWNSAPPAGGFGGSDEPNF